MGPVITLTTDFGLVDGYQAVLEGVIAGISPDARVVPISHEIEPGDIPGAWYLLKTHYRYFPPGTIHVAVVDPGVGSRRRIIAVSTERYQFIAPDNGLLSFVPDDDIISIHSVTDRKYALADVSPVFHGRDIMAPAAAYLSRGVDPSCLGRGVTKMVGLAGTMPRYDKDKIIGRVVWIDRFGNIISSIQSHDIFDKAVVRIGNERIGPVCRTFSDARRGELLAYVGSGGHLEIAVREGSAWEKFKVVGRERLEIEVARR
jgi:S-adenosylmethionine hydrolase